MLTSQLAYRPQQREAVHHGHVDVGQHHVDDETDVRFVVHHQDVMRTRLYHGCRTPLLAAGADGLK